MCMEGWNLNYRKAHEQKKKKKKLQKNYMRNYCVFVKFKKIQRYAV